jgi:site-specific recombinase XerD
VTNLSKLFEQFLQEKQYIKGVAPKTLRTYRDAWAAYERFQGCTCEVTEDRLKTFVIVATQVGVSPGAINSFARSLNSFLTWLADNGHIPQRLKVPKVKQPKRTLQTYSADDARRILSHKPRTPTEHRLLTILTLLVDAGLRITEALSLSRSAVDWDNLIIRVVGKGDKERIVPFSIECRKVLHRWASGHSHALLFATRDGSRLRYDNLRRDFLDLLDRVGVPKSEGAFHAFRRFAARQYLRNGGNVRYLQLLLGHSDIQTTTKYLDDDRETLRTEHKRLSPLESLRRL